MRDLIGYGENRPDFYWPNHSKIALNFVINYEEGSERSPLHSDPIAETYGGEFPLSPKPQGIRNLSMESLFEYGSRVGIWRLIHLFHKESIPLTFFATGMALKLNPELCHYLSSSSDEIAGHGWRWIDYAEITKDEERVHIKQCIQTIDEQTGKRIEGWYTGRRSLNTRTLLKEIGGFVYDSDSYADDLPYYEEGHLIIPYNLDCNDFRFSTAPGFNSGSDFFDYLCNSLDYLIQENQLCLMTVGLHPRLSGRPGRSHAIMKFIEHVKRKRSIWIARRIDIARYWQSNYQNTKL